MHINWLKAVFLYLNRNKELAWAVLKVMMVQAKRIYIFMIIVNKLIIFFVSWYFLPSYRNTCQSLGELKKAL